MQLMFDGSTTVLGPTTVLVGCRFVDSSCVGSGGSGGGGVPGLAAWRIRSLDVQG